VSIEGALGILGKWVLAIFTQDFTILHRMLGLHYGTSNSRKFDMKSKMAFNKEYEANV
jgi:hypothetical protein